MVFRNKLKSHWASQGKKCRRGDHINPLTPGAFCQKCVFWTFWWFLGCISAKLALIWSKMHLQHDSLPFLPLASCFTTFWLRRAQKSKFWDFWTRKWPTSLGFSIFEFFFVFPFYLFLFFSLQWLTFYWVCLRLKNFEESVIETGNFYHGAARCSGTKFCCEFFTQLFEHFCAYLRLNYTNHYDLGIIAKIFSSCRSWV